MAKSAIGNRAKAPEGQSAIGPMVYRVRNWAMYEPDMDKIRNRRSPLKYFRRFVADSAEMDRAEFEQIQRAVFKAGGLALWGMYDLLMGAAADRTYARGYFLTADYRPATVKEIAEILGGDQWFPWRAVQAALRKLGRP